MNKLEINIKESSLQEGKTPEISQREKDKGKDKDKDKEELNNNEFDDNLIFERSNEEDEEIKNLQKNI